MPAIASGVLYDPDARLASVATPSRPQRAEGRTSTVAPSFMKRAQARRLAHELAQKDVLIAKPRCCRHCGGQL